MGVGGRAPGPRAPSRVHRAIAVTFQSDTDPATAVCAVHFPCPGVPQVQHLDDAIAALKANKEFKKLLGMILTAGNRLNANTNRVALGFTIEELPKVAVMKSSDNSSTLLEFLVQQVSARFCVQS